MIACQLKRDALHRVLLILLMNCKSVIFAAARWPMDIVKRSAKHQVASQNIAMINKTMKLSEERVSKKENFSKSSDWMRKLFDEGVFHAISFFSVVLRAWEARGLASNMSKSSVAVRWSPMPSKPYREVNAARTWFADLRHLNSIQSASLFRLLDDSCKTVSVAAFDNCVFLRTKSFPGVIDDQRVDHLRAVVQKFISESCTWWSTEIPNTEKYL